MSKLYNPQQNFASSFNKFLKDYVPFIRKTQLNILPHIIWDMINAESAVASDITKHLKDFDFDNVQFDSKVKRIRRFFNNNLFDPINFYDYIIKHVIATNGDYKHTIIDSEESKFYLKIKNLMVSTLNLLTMLLKNLLLLCIL